MVRLFRWFKFCAFSRQILPSSLVALPTFFPFPNFGPTECRLRIITNFNPDLQALLIHDDLWLIMLLIHDDLWLVIWSISGERSLYFLKTLLSVTAPANPKPNSNPNGTSPNHNPGPGTKWNYTGRTVKRTFTGSTTRECAWRSKIAVNEARCVHFRVLWTCCCVALIRVSQKWLQCFRLIAIYITSL